MAKYIDNPSLKEHRSQESVLATFSRAERIAYKTMTPEEYKYLKHNCGIADYVEHLRKGAIREAVGSDSPIIGGIGSTLQLERFKTVFLMNLMDYQGVRPCQPSDFQLDNTEATQDLKYFPGVLIIRIPKGTATTQALDTHRVELINGVIATRQDLFNPTIILAEEKIAGNISASIFKFEKNKLRSDYEGNRVDVDDTVKSRKIEPRQIITNQNSNTSNNNSNSNNNGYNRANRANTTSIPSNNDLDALAKNKQAPKAQTDD